MHTTYFNFSLPVENPAWLDDSPDLHIVDKTFRLFFLTVVLLVAIGLNAAISYVLIRKRRLNTAGNQFTFSLSFSILLGAAWTLIAVLSSGIVGQWPLGQLLCQVTGFVHLLVMISSNLTMAMIAIDRYYAIVRPMMYHGELSRKRVLCMLSGTWLFSTLVSLCPAAGWSQFAYQPTYFTCSIVWQLQPVLSALIIIFAFCLPLLVISVIYTNIYFAANIQHKACLSMQSKESKSSEEGASDNSIWHAAISTTMAAGSSAPVPVDLHRRPLLSKRQRLFRDRLPWVVITYSSPAKALKTIIVILGGFLLSWAPLLGAILFQIGGVKSSRLAFSGYFFHCTSSVSCAVIYGLMNKMVRKRVRRLVTRGGKQKQAISVQYSPSYAGSFFDYLPRKLSTVGLPNIDPAEALRLAKNSLASPKLGKRLSVFKSLETPPACRRTRLGTMTRPNSAPSLTFMTSPTMKRKEPYRQQNPTFLTIPEEMCRRASPTFVVGTNIQREPKSPSPPTNAADVEASIVLRVCRRISEENSELELKRNQEQQIEEGRGKWKVEGRAGRRVEFVMSTPEEEDKLSLKLEVSEDESLSFQEPSTLLNMAESDSDFIDED